MRFISFALVVYMAVLGSGCQVAKDFKSDLTSEFDAVQKTMEPKWKYSDSPGIDNLKYRQAAGHGLIDQTYQAVDRLFSRSLKRIDKDKGILVTSIVDVKSVESSSALGLMMSEQVSSRAVQLGYKVHELKLRETIALRKDVGELALSRLPKDVRRIQSAQAIVFGTYAVGDDAVFVNLKVSEPIDGQIISSVDFQIPSDVWRNRTIRSLAD